MKKIIYTILLMAGSYSFAQGYPQMETMTLVPQNAPTNPIEGQVYYDIGQKAVFVYNGSGWVNSFEDTDNQTAAEVVFTPSGPISAVNVQGAIDELGLEKAADASVIKKSTSNIISSDMSISNGSGFGIDFEPNSSRMTFSASQFGSNTNLELKPNSLQVYGLSNAEIDAVGDGSLITKGYADANYSGDQTASEVSFTPNGSIAATTVQAAIEEVRDEASLMGVSGLIVNDIGSSDLIITANEFGKFNTSSSTITLTVDNSQPINSKAVFQPIGGNTIYVVPASGVTFIGTDIEEAFSVSENNLGGIFKIADNTYSVSGNVEAYTPPPSNLLVLNASHPTDEANSTNGWGTYGGSIDLSVDSDSYVGSYAIKGQLNANASVQRIHYNFSGEVGGVYEVRFRAKKGQGTNVYMNLWSGCTGGPSVVPLTSSYSEYVYTITATSADMRFDFWVHTFSGSGSLGDNIFVDDFTILKQD